MPTGSGPCRSSSGSAPAGYSLAVAAEAIPVDTVPGHGTGTWTSVPRGSSRRADARGRSGHEGGLPPGPGHVAPNGDGGWCGYLTTIDSRDRSAVPPIAAGSARSGRRTRTCREQRRLRAHGARAPSLKGSVGLGRGRSRLRDADHPFGPPVPHRPSPRPVCSPDGPPAHPPRPRPGHGRLGDVGRGQPAGAMPAVPAVPGSPPGRREGTGDQAALSVVLVSLALLSQFRGLVFLGSGCADI